MHAKKLLSLLLSALAAVTLLASCGSRWDYSQEAVKAANEVQGETLRVEFQINQKFTHALHDAVEENIQPADVEKAMLADASLKELLTSGYRLNVYDLRADVDAEEAARTIAEEQILPRLSGCKDEGIISIVKADNNYFYEAVLIYKESSSGNGGGGSSEPGQPDPQPTMYKITVENYDTSLGTVTAPEEVEKGGSFTFTVTPKNENVEVTVSVSGTCEFDAETYTVSNVQSDITITVVFEEKEEYPVQWYETNDGEYEAGTLIFRNGASAVMGNTHTLTLDATIKGLKAGQYLANPEAVADFSFQNVVHLIVKEGSGVTEIKGLSDGELDQAYAAAESGNHVPWSFVGGKKLESINLSGVNSIGDYAFGHGSIRSMKMSSTKDISIGKEAFSGSNGLVELEIASDGNLTIEYGAFSGAMISTQLMTSEPGNVSLEGTSITIEAHALAGNYIETLTLDCDTLGIEEDALKITQYATFIDKNYKLTIYCSGGEDAFIEACGGNVVSVGLTNEKLYEIIPL